MGIYGWFMSFTLESWGICLSNMGDLSKKIRGCEPDKMEDYQRKSLGIWPTITNPMGYTAPKKYRNESGKFGSKPRESRCARKTPWRSSVGLLSLLLLGNFKGHIKTNCLFTSIHTYYASVCRYMHMCVCFVYIYAQSQIFGIVIFQKGLLVYPFCGRN